MIRNRHSRDCSVCRHPEREAIEAAFTSWESPTQIARTHKVNVRAIHRHARAAGLIPTRDKNFRAALLRLLERGARAHVTASAVVQACMALAKINSNGMWIDRVERTDMNDLFRKMTVVELEKYAECGELPGWFPRTSAVALLPSGEARR